MDERRRFFDYMVEGEEPVPGHPLATRDKDAIIPHGLIDPHYTDTRFTHAPGSVTVFLAPGFETVKDVASELVPGAHYNYDDRLMQGYGYEEFREASRQAEEAVGNRQSGRYYEEMLRILYKSPDAELVHILAGVNRSNGYSYRVFGTVTLEDLRKQLSAADAKLHDLRARRERVGPMRSDEITELEETF